MPNPTTNFKDSFGTDLGNKLITKEYLMTVYPQIAANMITPELWTWGRNDSGQLGTNDTNTRCTPVTTLAGGANWKQVSCATRNTAAIKTDGTLWTWGYNSSGRLGVNDTTDRYTPVTTFVGGTDWKQVEVGSNHTVAIKNDGTLWTWGANGSGRLGVNDTNTRCTPVTTFAGGTDWKQVSCSPADSAAIKTDGTLWTWGLNNHGQLGVNDTDTRCTPVTTFVGGTNWKQVSCGNLYTAAIKTDGTLWTWGYNIRVQLGVNDTNTRCTPVTTFAGGTNWKQVSSSNGTIGAIKTDGTLWIWGFNDYGQLGNNQWNVLPITISGTMAPADSVFYAVDLNGLTSVNKSDYFYISNTQPSFSDFDIDSLFGSFPSGVIDIDTINNTITFNSFYFGTGFDGDLQFIFLSAGAANRSTPVTTFAGGTNWKQVACSGYYTAAIKTDGTLWTWGRNDYGQLGTNDTNNRCTPATTSAGGTNWKQVSSGSFHTAAIKTSDDLLGI